MKKDYSEYKPTENELYKAYRSNHDGVMLEYFNNTAVFKKDEKQIVISVDDYNEYYHMYPVIEEYTGKKTPAGLLANDTELPEFIKENKELQKKFAAKFNIDFSNSDIDIEMFHRNRPELTVEPLNNIMSGADIVLSYGEGILDFIYADFKTPTDEIYERFKMETALREAFKWGVIQRNEQGEIIIDKNAIKKELPPEEEKTEKIYSSTQEDINEYYDYKASFIEISDIAYASLYSAICPPVFKHNGDKINQIIWYGNYLLRLQQEYKEMIEFCFDEDYYPEVLSDKLPTERFYIYRRLKERSTHLFRTEVVAYSSRMDGEEMPYGMDSQSFISKVTANNKFTDSHKNFAKKFNLSEDELKGILAIPRFLSHFYTFGSVADILELEFTKMLEHNVRFRKCKRCGKYFIMKGNYDTNYCDRIAEGETRNCQDLAAQENYKKKMADNAAIPMYQKYYKRYSARVRVKQIKEDAFKKWKYQAITKRGECSDGIITLAEFEQWLESSFPNRKKKD